MSLTLTTYCSDLRQAGINIDLNLNIKLHRSKLVFTDYSFIKAISQGNLLSTTFTVGHFHNSHSICYDKKKHLKNMRCKQNSEPNKKLNALERSTS